MKRILIVGTIMLVIGQMGGCASMTRTSEDAKRSNAQYILGVSYLEQKHIQDAFLQFQRAVQLNPNNKEAYNMLGYTYTVLEQYDEALKSYARAIEIDPLYSEAYNNRSWTLILMERWDDAIASAEEALKNPMYATPEYALNNIGHAEMKEHRYEEAIAAFKKALKRRPLPLASYNLALAYLETGQDRTALHTLEELVERVPSYAHAHYQLARIYLRYGDTEKARKHFQEAARLAPDEEIGILAESELQQLR